MNRRLIALPILLSTVALSATAADSSQYIAIDSKLQIPGGTIEPGTYTLSIEKRLADRMLVRVARGSKDSERILLAVPNQEMSAETDASKGIVLFSTSDNKQAQVLRGWLCPNCTEGLEFVYPGAEARKITLQTGQASLAAGNGELQSTSIWKLSPKHISKSHRGVGIKPALFLHAVKTARAPTMVAGLKQLPKTATNTFSLALWGLVLLALAAALRMFSQKAARQ